MLDRKQIWVIFLFEFKMGRKAEEKTHNINWFVPGTANKHTAQWWLRKFCKGDERWRWGVWRPATGGDSREPSSKPILSRSFNYTRSCQRTPCQPVHGCLGIWSKLERWKSLINRCLIREQIKNFLNHRFAVSKHRFLCYRNKLISHWQKCVDCSGSYYIIKMCLSLVIMI